MGVGLRGTGSGTGVEPTGRSPDHGTMAGVTVDETPDPRSLRVAVEQAAMLGRARRGPRDTAVEVAALPAYDRVYGDRDSPLRRAVAAYLAQGGDAVLVVRAGDARPPAWRP